MSPFLSSPSIGAEFDLDLAGMDALGSAAGGVEQLALKWGSWHSEQWWVSPST